jgi:hypothetical protein
MPIATLGVALVDLVGGHSDLPDLESKKTSTIAQLLYPCLCPPAACDAKVPLSNQLI